MSLSRCGGRDCRGPVVAVVKFDPCLTSTCGVACIGHAACPAHRDVWIAAAETRGRRVTSIGLGL